MNFNCLGVEIDEVGSFHRDRHKLAVLEESISIFLESLGEIL